MQEADQVDSEIIFAVQEAPQGGFVTRALGQSIFTEADTMDELPHPGARTRKLSF